MDVRAIINSPGFWGILVTVIGTIVGLFFKDKAAKRKEEISLLVYHAFHIIQDWDRLEPSGWVNNAAQALKMIDDALVANGWRPLQPGEAASAQVALKSMAGQVAKQMAIAAQTAPTSMSSAQTSVNAMVPR